MIHVLATIETLPGKRDALLAEFRQILPLVRAEQGCLEYGAAVDVQTPISVQAPLRDSTVVIIEKWSDIAALQAHLGAPHMIDYRVKIREFVKGVRIEVLRPAE